MKEIIFITGILYFSLTANAQWTPSSNGNTSGVTHCFIESEGVLLSGGNGASVFASSDTGNSWSPSNTGIFGEVACMGKNSAGIFAGANNIYFSNDTGASWAIVNNSGNTTFAFAFFSDTIFAATMGGGVIMSADNGLTWITTNTGIPTNNIYSIVAKGNLLFAGTVGNGVFVSSNSGSSWSALNTGLPSPIVIRCLETDGTNLYAGTTDWLSPFIPQYGMFISSNNGASWTMVSNGITINSYVFDIKSIGNAVLAASHDIYRSLDNGLTWSVFMNGINTTCNYGAGGFLETSSYVFSGFEGGCAGTVFRINKDSVVFVNENLVSDLKFQVYPNPTGDKITFANTFSGSTITIINTPGQKMYSEKFEKELDISFLPAGVYVIELADKQKIYRTKFVKE